MKHCIIGVGPVGKSTGMWLEAHGEDVYYHDIDYEKVVKLKAEGKKAEEILPSQWDIAWICTHEKDAFQAIPYPPHRKSVTVIRSTVEPDFYNQFTEDQLNNIVSMPEFLRESSAVDDIFFPDRIVIGVPPDSENAHIVVDLMLELDTKSSVHTVPLDVASYIKLVSNAWLSTQLSFWNEIYLLLEKVPEHKQVVADVVTSDKRISQYGSKMIGQAFGGKCLPKDLDHIISMSKDPILFTAVKKVNEKMSKKPLK